MSTEVMIIPEKQQQAWIGLAARKNELVNHLTTAELQAQMLLAGETYEDIDTNLAAYRKAHADMVDQRKEFTATIDAGIIQPLMAFEKRVDPKANAQYIALSAKSLQLRKSAEQEAAAKNAKAQDASTFKAHCQNEFHRVATQYRGIIRQAISDQYKYSLEQKSCVNLTQLKEKLLLLEVPPVSAYKTTYHTREELAVLYEGIHKPDYGVIYREMMEELDQTFANFQSDIANAQAAIAHQQQQTALQQQAEQKQLAEESAINTLIATAETVVVDTPKIKRTLSIVVVESEQWAKTVMAAFITNLPHLAKYIRVKSWSKLSIGQMAEYLSKYSTDEEKQLNGFTYECIER